MSLFNWFKRKLAAAPQRPTFLSAPVRPEAVVLRPPATAPESLRYRSERMERREQLYSVVRDAMVRAGILSASYKFKVLALDQRGHQFLVMMDLAREYGSETARISRIEGVIAQSARTRHAIAVKAVYWRINDQIPSKAVPGEEALQGIAAPMPVPLAPSTSAPAALPAVAVAPMPSRSAVPAAPVDPVPAAAAVTATTSMAEPPKVSRPKLAPAPPDRLVAPRFDPIEAQEVAAFRKALAGAAARAPAASAANGVAVHSGPRHGSFAESEFPETQLPDDYEPRTRSSDLSTTQYGDL